MDTTTIEVMFGGRIETVQKPLSHELLAGRIRSASKNIIWMGGELQRDEYCSPTSKIATALKKKANQATKIPMLFSFGPFISQPENNPTLKAIINLHKREKAKFYLPKYRTHFHYWLIDDTLYYSSLHASHTKEEARDHFMVEGWDVREYVIANFAKMVKAGDYSLFKKIESHKLTLDLFTPLQAPCTPSLTY